MKRRGWVAAGALLLAVVLSSFVAWPATSPRIKLGEEIQFTVEDSSTRLWGPCCCCCEDSLIMGWRIVTDSGQVVYSVIHDAPVSSSSWVGTWTQIDSRGAAVSAGQYKLYVDTSVGTLSRCFRVYDPCSRRWCNPCCTSCTVCTDAPSITECSCKYELEFVSTCQTGWYWFPFFWGCCRCSDCP